MVLLEGQHVHLEPLSFGHLDGLCEFGLDEDLWRLTTIQVRTSDDMRIFIEDALRQEKEGTVMPFATIENATGRIAGSTRYLNMDLKNRRVEIGSTWVARPWQRTIVNTEAKYLMLRHAFETMGCMRVELKTDMLNERSQKAILRLGAKQEGIFRKHMVVDGGRIRDTVYFSIIDSEWPEVRTELERKLARAY